MDVVAKHRLDQVLPDVAARAEGIDEDGGDRRRDQQREDAGRNGPPRGPTPMARTETNRSGGLRLRRENFTRKFRPGGSARQRVQGRRHRPAARSSTLVRLILNCNSAPGQRRDRLSPTVPQLSASWTRTHRRCPRPSGRHLRLRSHSRWPIPRRVLVLVVVLVVVEVSSSSRSSSESSSPSASYLGPLPRCPPLRRGAGHRLRKRRRPAGPPDPRPAGRACRRYCRPRPLSSATGAPFGRP